LILLRIGWWALPDPSDSAAPTAAQLAAREAAEGVDDDWGRAGGSASSNDSEAGPASLAGRSATTEDGSKSGVDRRRDAESVAGKKPASESDSQGSVPIFLDALARAPEVHTVALSGVDPHAPRELVAWRVKNGRRAIIARGRSGRDGRLEFPDVVAPRDGLEIVVTAADSAPGIPGASIARKLEGRNPHAPNGALMEIDGPDYLVRIVPNEFAGHVLLADSQGVVFARYPVVSSPLAAARVIDLALNPAPGDFAVLSAHEFADGRRSEWREIALDAPGVAPDGDPY
jgi:hypothetical protein